MADTNQIRERAVCYLDLMGFSNAVNSASNSEERISDLVSILEDIETRVLQGYSESRLTFQHLSDSIFIATDGNDAEDIEQLVLCVQDISLRLMTNRFLVRGGISSGLCSVAPSIVVGKPVVHAVKLEQFVAVNPRVIIGGQTVKHLRNKGIEIETMLRGSDGIYWINPFPVLTRPIIEIHRSISKGVELPTEKISQLRNERDRKIEQLNEIIDFIGDMLESLTEEEKLFKRYYWIESVLSAAVSECRTVVGESVKDLNLDL